MEIPRHWRLKAQRYRLEGSICPACGQLNFPPRPVCTACAAQPAPVAAHGFVLVPLEGITARQAGLDISQNESLGLPGSK